MRLYNACKMNAAGIGTNQRQTDKRIFQGSGKVGGTGGTKIPWQAGSGGRMLGCEDSADAVRRLWCGLYTVR